MTTTSIPAPVDAFIERVNAHDAQAFLDAFVPNAIVDDWGREFAGRAAIEAWSDREFIGSRGVLSVEEVEVEGDRITVVGDWRSNHANGRSRFVFETDGDRLTRMTIREG